MVREYSPRGTNEEKKQLKELMVLYLFLIYCTNGR